MDDAREARIDAWLERLLRAADATAALADVEPDIRDELAQRLRDAEFIDEYFAGLPPPGTPPPRPRHIAGCELYEVLGSGAMGEVLRARQLDLGRDIAIKLMRAELADRDDFLARFAKEARTLAALDHPGIVKVLFSGTEQGWLYFGMELVRGRDLATAMAELRQPLLGNEPRRHDRVVRLTAELLETLAYAHRNGIAHRDVKPSNVMLDGDGHPKLVDFGLAHGGDGPGVTLPGVLLGTPSFLSPEAALRRPRPRTADDLWAAGVILYELLTGTLPYAGRTIEEVLRQLQSPRHVDPRARNADVPPALAAICRRALAPDPADRYATAQQFAGDLRRFLADEPVLAARRSPWHALRSHWRRRHRWYVAAGAALALGGAIWFAAERNTTQRQIEAAVTALGDAPVLDGVPARELARRAEAARTLLANARLTAAQRAAVTAQLAAIERQAQQSFDRGAENIRQGAGSPRGTPLANYRSPTPAQQWLGMREAAEAALVVPTLGDALALLDATLPVLHVADPTGGPGGATVRVVALDPATGQVATPVFVGNTPCDVPVPPGHYRIVVGDQAHFAELTRSIAVPGVYDLAVLLKATAEATAGMIEIPAGTARIGQSAPGAVVYQEQTIAHPAFWIDRTEVTCAEYAAFCSATGAALPYTWPNGYQAEWADLPVVGVTAEQAAAYAEWRGKRLPSWTEWQVAARGPLGFEYPWGNDPAPMAEMQSIGWPLDTPWTTGLRAVGTATADESPFHVRDMLANASEWTETPYVAQIEGAPFPVYPWRLCGGASWDHDRNEYARLSTVNPGQPELRSVGFRCAKSSAP